MIKLVFLIVPIFIYAESLQSLLDYASKHSDLVITKVLSQKAKNKELEAKESAYYPTIDTGAFYQTLNERSPFFPGDMYSAYAKVSLDVYDGGRKSSLIEMSEKEYIASSFDSASTKKNLSLEIVQDFFTIKSLEASLLSKYEVNKSLLEQLNRMKKFYSAKLATKDNVDKLQAAFDGNVYEIEIIKYKILSAKSSLELKVGKNISSLDNSKFKEFKQQNIELVDNIKSLLAQKDAVISGARSVESVYFPQIKIEDTYSIYGYDRTDAFHPEGADNQNKLLVSLNMRIFDYGTVSKTKESILINSRALDTQIVFSKKEQKMQYLLALSAIQTNNALIKSAKSGLVAAESAFKTISKKYEAGIVDNIAYLDALSYKDTAKSLYEKSLNDLEISYAKYYYYAGKNIEEFLK